MHINVIVSFLSSAFWMWPQYAICKTLLFCKAVLAGVLSGKGELFGPLNWQPLQCYGVSVKKYLARIPSRCILIFKICGSTVQKWVGYESLKSTNGAQSCLHHWCFSGHWLPLSQHLETTSELWTSTIQIDIHTTTRFITCTICPWERKADYSKGSHASYSPTNIVLLASVLHGPSPFSLLYLKPVGNTN